MKQRTIAGREVGAIGLGCMGMSWLYGAADNAESVRVLNRALELGVNHWDTADVYGAGDNERLLAEVLKTRRDEVFLATKFANVYDRSLTSHQDQVEAGVGWIVDGTPAYIQKTIDLSLQRLGVDHIDLYYLHRVDNTVPIEETVGAMGELVKAGKVKAIGVSEVNADTLRRAHATHPLAATQNEYSLWTRDSEDDVLPACEELGIAFVPYSPLGRGFLTGQIKSIDDLAEDDWRRNNPRFQGENFAANLRIVDIVNGIAEKHGAANSQVALAWILAKSGVTAPIPGTKRVKYLEENAGAASLELTAEEIHILSDISGVAGQRYPDAVMSMQRR
jgi:aryl-alcohol dehydrogenase-like predicted oxidoreductase